MLGKISRNKKQSILYFLLTISFIFLWFKLVDVGEAISLIRKANWFYIIIAVVLGVIQSFLSSFRLKTLLSLLGKISALYIWPLGYVGALISLIFPFSLGGFSMAYFISKKLKTTYAKSLSVIFIDYILAVLLTVFIAIIAIPFFSQKKLLSVDTGIFPYILLVFAGVFVIYSLAYLLRSKIKFLNNVFFRLKDGLKLLVKSRQTLLKAVSLTLFIASLGAVHFYLYFMAFGMRPGILEFILASSLFGILGLIPGAPTKLGQYETLGVLTLPYLLNLDKTAVFAALLTAHLVSITGIFIGGIISLYYLKFDLNLVKKLDLRRFS